MGTINPATVSDGDTIDASDLNNPINTIANEINGNLDAANLASSAVSTAKIANNAVTPPKISNDYMFAAYPSATTTLTDNVAVQVTFGNELYDYNSNFASSAYTAPVDGVYHFDACVTINTGVATGVDHFTMLYKDTGGGAAEIRRGARVFANNFSGASVSCDLLLNAGDIITVYSRQNSAGDEDASTSETTTYFNGHLVRQTPS